jgi:CO/xanthine dehydrogenase FAD-binding subunit
VVAFANLVQPVTAEEAYKILIEKKNNAVLGGCAFLRLGSSQIGTAIDLTKLDLDYIKERDGYIEIGAMTTFRSLETNRTLNAFFNGVLPKAVSNVIGVQFRNIVTIGATVYSRYGFSDLLTALMVLDTEVELVKAGRMPLVEYMGKINAKDILIRIFIKKNQRKAAYQSLRNSASDYPILNVAVARLNTAWTISVGARPLGAKIAEAASAFLSAGDVDQAKAERAAVLATAELSFGANMRGTAEYRQAMCKVLVGRAIAEVSLCK